MQIEVKGIGIVEVPDTFADLDPESQKLYVQKIKLQTSKQQSTDPVEEAAEDLSFLDKLQGGTRAFAQGLTFGFADEIEAGLRTGGGLIGDYSKTVKGIRDDLNELRAKNTGLALSSEIAGAFLPSLAAGLFTGGAGTGAGLAATGARVAQGAKAAQAAKVSSPSLLKSMGQGAGRGAAYGTAYGVGTAEGGLGERTVGGITGGLTGGVLGGAVPVALQGGIGAAKTLGKSFGVGGTKAAEKFSDVKILQALERDGLSRQGAIEKLKAAEKLGQKDLLIADLGEELSQLGYASQAIAGGARKDVADKLYNRSSSQSERITEDLIDQTKLKGPFSLEYVDDLSNIQKAASKPAYEKAYAKTVSPNASIKVDGTTASLKDFFTGSRKELMIQAAKDGVMIAKIDGDDVVDLAKILKDPDLTKEFLSKPIETKFLHTIKKGMDSIIDKGTDSFGKVNPMGVAVIKAKNTFNKIIERSNPAYAKANKDFSDVARLKDAFNIGIGQKRFTTERLSKLLKGMNDAEKEAFRVGLVARIQKKSDDANFSTDFTKTIFGSTEKENLVRLAFPQTKQGMEGFKNFKQIIELEKKKVQTKNTVLGNSATNKRGEVMRDAEIDPTLGVVGRALVGDPQGAARQGLAAIGARSSGLNPESANLLAKKLFQLSPQEQIRYLSGLGASEQMLVQQSLNALKLQAGLSAGAGTIPSLLTQ